MADAFAMENQSENPPCAVCGQAAVVVIHGVAWCDGCFHEMGSCCGEWHEDVEAEEPS
jgi:hypothetical protein